MKILGIIAAVIGFALAPAPAAAYAPAQIVPSAIVLVPRADVAQRWDDRRYDRGRGYDRRRWDRGRHRGWRNNRWRWRTNCYTQWRGGRRERVCRRIRYR